jgi:hypothetical protein
VRPLSSTNQRPEPAPATYTPATPANGNGALAVAPADESPEELTKRCQAIMNQVRVEALFPSPFPRLLIELRLFQSDVVLFMKGNPEVPRCGFSQQTVNILKEQGVEYTTFDILGDEAVRQRAFDSGAGISCVY